MVDVSRDFFTVDHPWDSATISREAKELSAKVGNVDHVGLREEKALNLSAVFRLSFSRGVQRQ